MGIGYIVLPPDEKQASVTNGAKNDDNIPVNNTIDIVTDGSVDIVDETGGGVNIERDTPATLIEPDDSKFPSSCYDKITVREKGHVYIFKSKRPLQEGVNPRVFKDLPTYRVWAERTMEEGLRCPILFYDPNEPPYVHPEEEYPAEVPMVKNNIVNGQQRHKYDIDIIYRNGQGSKPYLTRDGSIEIDTLEIKEQKNSYIRSAMTDSAKYIPVDGINDSFVSSEYGGDKYAEAYGKPMRVRHRDLINVSRRDAFGLGADESTPVPPYNSLRDVPKSEVLEMLERENPIFRGAKIKRTGISRYEVEELKPQEKYDTNNNVYNSNNLGYLPPEQPMPVDLLAYGGTVVPVRDIRKIF